MFVVAEGSSKLFIMKPFQRKFLVSMHQSGSLVWIWCSLHGSQEETRDFEVEIFALKTDNVSF
jgi:hypothetical protein